MTDMFHLVDLDRQADAVWQHVQGWPKERILAWLAQRGVVQQAGHPMDADVYGFESASGVRTTFRLTRTGQLVIVRADTLYQPGQA